MARNTYSATNDDQANNEFSLLDWKHPDDGGDNALTAGQLVALKNGVREAAESDERGLGVPGDLNGEHWIHKGIGVSIYMHRSGVVVMTSSGDHIVTDAETLDYMSVAKAGFAANPGPATVTSDEVEPENVDEEEPELVTDGGVDVDELERTELDYHDRQELETGEEATLVYDSPYSGTRVERTVTITDTVGRVAVELEDGTEWGIRAGGIRTTVDNRRASGETDAKNGRTVGYLVALKQDVDVVDEDEGDVVAIVGCGSAKLDLNPGETAPVRDLYTSGYFTKKREFAEELADRWYVLSAEYALVKPWLPVETYEKEIGDLEGVELEKWQGDVGLTLLRAIGPYDRVVVLGGRDYVNALRDVIAEYGLEIDVVDPFAETSGIGDQNGWMANALAAGTPFHPVGQDDEPELVADGGEVVDDVAVPIKIECADCGGEYTVEEESAESHVDGCPIREAFINSGRWDDPNDGELVTDGGQEREDDLEYWRGELRAFLDRNDGRFLSLTPVVGVDEPDHVTIRELDDGDRSELEDRLEAAGFRVKPFSYAKELQVVADERRLEYSYRETSGVGDSDLMTDGRGLLNPVSIFVGLALVAVMMLVMWVLAGGSL